MNTWLRCVPPASRHFLITHAHRQPSASSTASLRRLASTFSLDEKRDPNYAVLSDAHLSFFERTLGTSGCVTDPRDLLAFNSDWLRTYTGSSKLTLLPQNTAQLSAILTYCHEQRLAVCPQGGNTGLVCGSVPIYDELVVSTKRLNRILAVDTDSNIVSCQSGCILQHLDEHLSSHSLMMPLDLGAKGSCHIGGNVSTNAGGLRLLRYGSLKQNVLGLEVVLADGRVLDVMRPAVRKDNTGYDLKQLFVGAEGTLGIVSAVSILCPVKPKSSNLIFVACTGASFESSVLDVFKLAKLELNEILSAFEFMDAESMRSVCENLKLENPFRASSGAQVARDTAFYCLAETHGSCGEHDMRKVEAFFAKLSGARLCADAIIAEAPSAQFDRIWSLRERLAESLKHDGYNYKYDISLPLKKVYELVSVLRRRLDASSASYVRCIGYGHLGDGNLHLNVTSREFDEALFGVLEPFVYEWTRDNHGSVSAEHGLGHKKRNFIYMSKSAEAVAQMKHIKQMFDPRRILNPYKVLPVF